jgi:chitodextrinase
MPQPSPTSGPRCRVRPAPRELALAAGLAAAAIVAAGAAAPAAAQDNYEIQVYGADTVAPGSTMVELHSNYTLRGGNEAEQGVRPTAHAWHETLEITHGFTPWFEAAVYTFTSAQARYGWDWVGNHLRLRGRVPEAWGWPVGVSLSTEFGYQRRAFSADTWTLELRPIVDKQVGRWYLAFNPTVDRSFHGPGTSQGVVFSPDLKVGYDFTKKINAGVEYYGTLGPLSGFDPVAEQQHQIVPSLDLNVSPDWELNFGVAFGVTHATDRLLVKMILGRRFGAGGHQGSSQQ